jgi:hypothetical protein
MALIRVLTYQGGDERDGDNAGEKGFGLLGVVRRFLFGLIEDWGNLKWCYTVQSVVTLSKVVSHCPKCCYTVQSGVTLSKVLLHCPKVLLHCLKWCHTVQSGVTLSKVLLHCPKCCYTV